METWKQKGETHTRGRDGFFAVSKKEISDQKTVETKDDSIRNHNHIRHSMSMVSRNGSTNVESDEF